jgi:hypothetical protein
MFKSFLRSIFLDRSVPQTRTNLASLVLRLALAGIVLNHGRGKVVGERNAWRSNWMATMVNAPPGGDLHPPSFTGCSWPSPGASCWPAPPWCSAC